MMTKPVPDVNSPLLLACRELGRSLDAFDESACAALNLARNDLRALNLLEHGPLTAGTLADRLGLSRPAVTALIDRLVNANYAQRVAVPGDRRATAVQLRPATWRAFAKVYRPLGERVSTATAGLSNARRGAITAAMLTIAAAVDEARAANVSRP